MKTCTFIFWIYLLVLFPHDIFSKSSSNKEQYSSDSKNLNQNSDIDVGNEDVALHESFRPRHKYKANGRQTRVYRSDSENVKDLESKAAQCAVMYKDNEPVGILQPFKESYRFLPISGDPTLVDLNPIPVKRKTFMDVLYPNNKMNEDYNEETAENNNQFADDRYPSIFAKFKIDSRLDKNLNPDLNMKRSMYKRDKERPAISDEQVNSLKTTLSKMKGDNSAVVEEELKNILDDMGLIEDYDESKEEAKREVEEDENMEQGTNKINLMKEVHNETRNKRADGKGTTDVDQNSTITTPATTLDANATSTLPTNATYAALPTKARFEEERTIEADIDLFKDGDAKVNDDSEKEDLEVSTESGLEESRKKRQFEEKEAKEGNNQNEKRDTTDDLPDINVNSSTLVKESELNEYEKRVEREIRERIQKLKEEVKEEIKNLKGNSQEKKEELDNRRKKRQVVNSLINEETPNIDPNLNDDNPQEEHHVRRKRSLLSDYSSTIDKSAVNDHTMASSDLNDRFKQEYQMINDSKNGLRFIINFGDIDPKTEENITSNVIGKEGTYDKINKFNTTSAKIDNKNNTNVEANIPVHFNTSTNATVKLINNPLAVESNVVYNVTCGHTSYSMCQKCHNYKKDILRTENKKQKQQVSKTKIEGKIKNRITTLDNREPKISFNETDRKANIINILNVISKKKYVNKNSDQTPRSTSDQKFADTLTPVNEKVIDKILNSSHLHDEIMKEILHDEIMKEIGNAEQRKRFVGINPILENTTNLTDHYHSRSLKEYDENIKTNVESYDEKILEDIQNIGKMKRFVDTNPFQQDTSNITNYDYYQSRNLKQFNEDTTKKNAESGKHVRVKRSVDAEETEQNSDKRENVPRKRQAGEDSVENAYQYDDPEFSEEAINESQSYYDQPFANDNVADNTFISNVKSNCNCDKSGSGCKCGTQRTDLSVPNIKQEYSDYMENPRSLIEKKSASHCNCDKNGKHCKCQTFGEGSHYSDYGEEQSIEAQSSDLDDDPVVSNEVQNGPSERVPRRSRQKRKNSGQLVEKSNTEDVAEDYYDNYETGGGKLMKREVKPRKLPENQQFQNGEYFVDLHPDVYRLTPVETSRKKRNSFKELVAIHGGGPVVNHLVAIRQRSMLPHPRVRRRIQNEDNREPRQLIDMSDEDLFGALPQSFAGELARYKRVKRGDTEK